VFGERSRTFHLFPDAFEGRLHAVTPGFRAELAPATISDDEEVSVKNWGSPLFFFHVVEQMALKSTYQ